MRHFLPPTPAFRDVPPNDPIQEIALRVVAELPNFEMHVLGSATLIGSYLAITAKHVISDGLIRFGAKQGSKGLEVESFALRVYQVLPGPVYRIWNVPRAWHCSTDITILHLQLDGTSNAQGAIDWATLALRMMPPRTGQHVWAVGFRESRIEVTRKPDGSTHTELNDILTTSIGEVGQVYPERRDSVMCPFPCYEVNARFASGMSGGLVIDEEGALCGLICSSVDLSDPTEVPLSYAATLWPILATVISADRGAAYSRNVEYPLMDLARDKIINVLDLEELDPKLHPGVRNHSRTIR